MSKHDVTPRLDASDAGREDGAAGADHHVADAREADSAQDGGASHDASDGSTDANLTMCDGGAVDLEKDPQHCGTCSHVCPAPEAGLMNEQATCASGVCGISCMPGFGNCNDGGMGCTFELSSVPSNCGACGRSCSNAGTASAPTCMGGACVFECSPGFLHCSADDATGCETAVDDENCGYCNYSCGSGTCTQGICKLTAGSEQFQQNPGISALIQDSTTAAGGSLYWVSSGSPHSLRRMHKDGSGLITLNGGSPPPPSESFGESITVDDHNVYYFDNSGKGLYAESVGNTSGAAISLPGFDTLAGSATGFLCDGDLTHAATGVFYAQQTAGLWKAAVPPSGAALLQLTSDNPVGGMALWGDTLYFSVGAGSTATLESVTTTQTTTGAIPLTTVTGGAVGIATDGKNIYVLGYDPPNVTTVSIATKSSTLLAMNGPGQGTIVTDGTNVYFGSANVYRVPVGATNATLSAANTVFSTTTFGAGAVYGLQVDDTSLYIATDSDVWKTHR